MDSFNCSFMYQTSKDYDVAQFHVEAIAKNSIDLNDFYKNLEKYVTDRKSLFK